MPHCANRPQRETSRGTYTDEALIGEPLCDARSLARPRILRPRLTARELIPG
jgi:hypothetical protein